MSVYRSICCLVLVILSAGLLHAQSPWEQWRPTITPSLSNASYSYNPTAGTLSLSPGYPGGGGDLKFLNQAWIAANRVSFEIRTTGGVGSFVYPHGTIAATSSWQSHTVTWLSGDCYFTGGGAQGNGFEVRNIVFERIVHWNVVYPSFSFSGGGSYNYYYDKCENEASITGENYGGGGNLNFNFNSTTGKMRASYDLTVTGSGSSTFTAGGVTQATYTSSNASNLPLDYEWSYNSSQQTQLSGGGSNGHGMLAESLVFENAVNRTWTEVTPEVEYVTNGGGTAVYNSTTDVANISYYIDTSEDYPVYIKFESELGYIYRARLEIKHTTGISSGVAGFSNSAENIIATGDWKYHSSVWTGGDAYFYIYGQGSGVADIRNIVIERSPLLGEPVDVEKSLAFVVPSNVTDNNNKILFENLKNYWTIRRVFGYIYNTQDEQLIESKMLDFASRFVTDQSFYYNNPYGNNSGNYFVPKREPTGSDAPIDSGDTSESVLNLLDSCIIRAFINRSDLLTRDCDTDKLIHGGEFRLIFQGHTNAFNIIFEFKVPVDCDEEYLEYINNWRQLESDYEDIGGQPVYHNQSGQYLPEKAQFYNRINNIATYVLANYTNTVDKVGELCPTGGDVDILRATPTGSYISQVRTNEGPIQATIDIGNPLGANISVGDISVGGWEFREFELRLESNQPVLGLRPLKNTLSQIAYGSVVPDGRGSTSVSDFINNNKTSIIQNRGIDIPYNLSTASVKYLIQDFVKPIVTNVNIIDDEFIEARHIVSLNTCVGCHAGEVKKISDTNLVNVPPYGSFKAFASTNEELTFLQILGIENHPSPFASFLTGKDRLGNEFIKEDLYAPGVFRRFNELDRRRLIMELILSGVPFGKNGLNTSLRSMYDYQILLSHSRGH